MVNSVGLRDSLEIKESFDYYTEVLNLPFSYTPGKLPLFPSCPHPLLNLYA
jgi:hypothetical protein